MNQHGFWPYQYLYRTNRQLSPNLSKKERSSNMFYGHQEGHEHGTGNRNNFQGLVSSILYHLSKTEGDGRLSTHVSTEITTSISPKHSLTQTRIETNSSLLLSTSDTGLNTFNTFNSIVWYNNFIWLSCWDVNICCTCTLIFFLKA